MWYFWKTTFYLIVGAMIALSLCFGLLGLACQSQTKSPSTTSLVDQDTSSSVETEDSLEDTENPQDTASEMETSTQSDSEVDSGVDTDEPPVTTACNDGIDNDGDGLMDWQFDLGCYGPNDLTEEALSREEENGWTTYDPAANTIILYVSSSSGDDSTAEPGNPERPFASIATAVAMLRQGMPDWMLLKRGDSWEEVLQSSNWTLGGESLDAPMLIASYGDSVSRPILNTGLSVALRICCEEHLNLTIMGLDFRSHLRDPESADFVLDDGETGLYRYGLGGNFLMEDCRFSHFRTNTLHTGSDVATNLAFRRNVVVNQYRGTDELKSHGMFASGVDGLLMEENIFDHNGWSSLLPEGEASKYNHNLYISENHNVTLRKNLFLRASSIGSKIRSDEPLGSTHIVIEDNFYVEGELGILLGGNDSETIADRFEDVLIQNNVFLHLGRSNPTGRDFGWAITIDAITQGEILNNTIAHNAYDNAIGISLSGPTAKDIVIENNLVYGYRQHHLKLSGGTDWSNLQIQQNMLQSTDVLYALVRHLGPLSVATYDGNHYFAGSVEDYFATDDGYISYAEWLTVSQESGSNNTEITFSDPQRSLASYHESLGLEGTYEAFLEGAGQQSRLSWSDIYTTDAVNSYILDGL